MTKREAAIVSAFTGIMLGNFSELHAYIEEIMDRPVWTHEMADPITMGQIKEKAKKDFIGLEVV